MYQTEFIKKFSTPLLFLAGFLLFFIYTSILFDTDFGWHLKLGQLIVTHGVPHSEPYSYTMPSYPYVDFEWLSNVCIYIFYSTIGWTGLSLIFSFIPIVSLWITSSIGKRSLSIIPVILTVGVFFPRTGIRVQVISWLLWAGIYRIVWNEVSWKRYRLLAVPLLFLWTNFHGSFPLGVIILVLASVYYWIRDKDDYISLFLSIIFLCIPFVNPYGGGLLRDIWIQMSYLSRNATIYEWRPLFVKPELPLLALFVLSGFSLWYSRRRFSLISFCCLGITGYLAVSAQRHGPFFALTSIPFISLAIEQFQLSVKNVHLGIERLHTFLKIGVAISVFLFVIEYSFSLAAASSFREDQYYPKDAVTFLKQHPFTGHLFALYEWGGYLIWKMPEEKVFIDGRMPTFRWNGAPVTESSDVFTEYQYLEKGKRIDELFEKYNISTVLWSKQAKNYVGIEQTILFKELTKRKWTLIYEDSISVIYQKFK